LSGIAGAQRIWRFVVHSPPLLFSTRLTAAAYHRARVVARRQKLGDRPQAASIGTLVSVAGDSSLSRRTAKQDFVLIANACVRNYR